MSRYRYTNRTGKKKKGLSNRQKHKLFTLSCMLAVFVLLLGIFYFSEQNCRDLDEQNLTSRQLCSFMSFYEYDEQQWYEYLLNLGMQEMVTWDRLELYFNSLGVKEYLSYDRPKQDQTVSYGEFLALYPQILSLLDGDKKVQTETLTLETVRENQDQWESGTTTAQGDFYEILTGAKQYKKGKTYVLYITGQKILGILAENVKTEEESTTKIPEISDEDTVAVLLQNGNTPFRQQVYLFMEGEYTKTERSGKKKPLTDGYLLKLTSCREEKEPKEDQYMLLTPTEESCRIYFADKTGKKLSQGYRGEFRIYRYPKGYVAVNVLSIREYLYGVVPSEMPSDYEQEALKAQAVCARSYAYQHLNKGAGTDFYADLDDTVQYQVYNKSGDSQATRKAVDNTKNQVLTYEGRLAETYYFSTSCGITQGYDLWGLNQEKFGYLCPSVLHKEGLILNDETVPDLSTEEGFRTFLKQDTEEFYENSCRYFRWKATFSYKEYADALNKAIWQRKQAADTSVEIFDEKGNTLTEMDKLGKPLKLKVEKRSNAGGITKLYIQYENGSVKLTSEYTIRYCLGACSPKVVLKDGAAVHPELLPSACFYIVSQKNGKAVLSGGGFGHGLGMSQNGADALAKDGWRYKDILQFFYHGVELVKTVQ